MKPYRPSNGTEGDFFQVEFCQRCRKDSERCPCPILGRTMAYDLRDPKYPKEWIADDDLGNNARCTAFEAKGSKPRTRRFNPRQLGLFQ